MLCRTQLWVIPSRSPDRSRDWGKSENKRGDAHRTEDDWNRDDSEKRRHRRRESENRNSHSNRNWENRRDDTSKGKYDRESSHRVGPIIIDERDRSSRRSRDRMERTKEHSKEYSSYEERAKDGDERVKHPRDIDTRTRHSEAFHTLAERLRLKKETRKAHDSALLQQKDEKDKKFQSIIQENQQPNEKESAEEKTSTVKDAENVAKKHEDLAKNVTDESENKKENFVITAFGSRIIQSDNKLIRRKVESKKEQIPKNDDIDPFGIFGERKLDDILKRTKNKNSCQKTQKPLVKTISNGPENILGVRKGILKRTKSYEKTVKSTEEESSKIISTDDSSEPKHSTNNVSNSPEKLATVSKDAPSNLTGSCEDAKYLPKTIVKKSENQSYISDEKVFLIKIYLFKNLNF